MPSESAGDRDAVVGDECHIVGQTPDSARFRDDLPIDSDSYDNLIVLCKTHHKQIDDQPERFGEEDLLAVKSAHEQWVRAILDIGKPNRSINPVFDGVTMLPRIKTGKQLILLCLGCTHSLFVYDDVTTVEEAGALSDFISQFEDLKRFADLRPSDVVKAGFEFKSVLDTIQNRGFLIFGEQQTQKRRLPPSITSDEIYMKVQTALIAIYRVTSSSTIDLDDAKYAVVNEPFIE